MLSLFVSSVRDKYKGYIYQRAWRPMKASSITFFWFPVFRFCLSIFNSQFLKVLFNIIYPTWPNELTSSDMTNLLHLLFGSPLTSIDSWLVHLTLISPTFFPETILLKICLFHALNWFTWFFPSTYSSLPYKIVGCTVVLNSLILAALDLNRKQKLPKHLLPLVVVNVCQCDS